MRSEPVDWATCMQTRQKSMSLELSVKGCRDLLPLQRLHEERRALFSCFYWAVFSWNQEELATAGPPPDAGFWSHILVSSCRDSAFCRS